MIVIIYLFEIIVAQEDYVLLVRPISKK